MASHSFLYIPTPPTYGMNTRGLPGILAPRYHELHDLETSSSKTIISAADRVHVPGAQLHAASRGDCCNLTETKQRALQQEKQEQQEQPGGSEGLEGARVGMHAYGWDLMRSPFESLFTCSTQSSCACAVALTLIDPSSFIFTNKSAMKSTCCSENTEAIPQMHPWVIKLRCGVASYLPIDTIIELRTLGDPGPVTVKKFGKSATCRPRYVRGPASHTSQLQNNRPVFNTKSSFLRGNSPLSLHFQK